MSGFELLPNHFTVKQRADKAINSLRGILKGIQLDRQIKPEEANELLLWSRNHNDLIAKNPFREFMQMIEKLIQYEVPSVEAIEDMFWLCDKYENGSIYFSGLTADLQILQGLCHGILADGELHDDEIFGLHKWLEENNHLATYYPYDEIRSLVLSVVSDKKVSDDEKIVLSAYFQQFVSIQDVDVSQKLKSQTENILIGGLCTSDPEVTFPGKTFCITGILKRSTREKVFQEISQLGGIPTDSVTKKTDYLIVGDNGNPAWAFTCYGRKVEKAVQMRKEGHKIVLIHEFDFCDILDDTK